jgi:hypothetical protein
LNGKKFLRKLRYFALMLTPQRKLRPSAEPIDVIIPVVEKDLDVLPLALEGLRANVSHTIAAIYLVSPASERVHRFCADHGLQFVDENTVLGYGARDVNLVCTDGTNRSGWLFQQLLKLSNKIGTSPYYLTIDSDHILLRPHTFVTSDGRSVFYRSYEYHPPYYDNLRRLVGMDVAPGLSYVAHKMIFKRELVAQLQQYIESHNDGLRWDEAIRRSVDCREISGFSEFELYGNFVPRSRKTFRVFGNHHLSPSLIAPYDALRARWAGVYKAITFPAYKA